MLLVSFFILLIIQIFIGVPIAFALAGCSIFYFLVQGHIPFMVMIQRLYSGGDSFSLLAIPFFVLSGELMTQMGFTSELVAFANSILGRLKAGLALVDVAASMLFAGLSGSGSADAAAIGSVMLPTLEKKGYAKGFSASIEACSGAIGPIIPPSLLMIIYGSLAGISISKLFLGGVFPGILMGLSLMIGAYLFNLKYKWDEGTDIPFSIKRIWETFKNSITSLFMPIIILGGIISGIFTATEAGVVSVVYALIVGFIMKRITLGKLRNSLLNGVAITAQVVFIICMATVTSWIFSNERFASKITSGLIAISGENQFIGILITLGALLLLGSFIEVIALLIIFVPTLASLSTFFGLDSIHWGLLVILAINLGGVTPPVATNLLITSGIAKASMSDVLRYIYPLLFALLIVLLLCVLFPNIVMFLPNLFMK